MNMTHKSFVVVAAVCKQWKAEVELSEFRRLRKLIGHSQQVFVLVQA